MLSQTKLSFKIKLTLLLAASISLLFQVLITSFLLQMSEIPPILVILIGLIPSTGYILFLRKNHFPPIYEPKKSTPPSYRLLSISLIFIGILILVFHKTLLFGRGLFPADAILNYLPWKAEFNIPTSNWLLADQYKCLHPWHHWFNTHFSKGKLPLWNPYINCGVPSTASLQAAALFPINLLLIPLQPFFASGLAAFIKLAIAGYFMMLYVRELGVSKEGSLLSAISFSLCSFMIVWLGHPHVNCAMWFPALLYFIERRFNTPIKSTLWFSGIAISYGCLLLGGHPPTMVHVSIITIMYFICKSLTPTHRKQFFSHILWLIGAFCLGILIAAPQILSFLEYYQISSSSLSSQQLNRADENINFISLIQLFFPYIGGSPHLGFERTAWLLGSAQNFNERTIFTGTIPLFFAFTTIFYRRCRIIYFWLTIILISFFIAFGVYPFTILLKYTPLLNITSNMRFLFFICFAVAVLSGLGFDQLPKIKENRIWKIMLSLWWIGLLMLSCWILKTIPPAIKTYGAPYRELVAYQLLVTFTCTGIITITFFYNNLPRWSKCLLLLGIVLEMSFFAMEYNPTVKKDHYYPKTQSITFFKKQQDPLFRIFAKNGIFPPNIGQVYNLYDVRGQDFTTLKRYEELITGKAGSFWFFSSKEAFFPSLHYLNVKYIMTKKNAKLPTKDFTKVYDKEVAIYRFNSFNERALLVYNYQVESSPKDMLSILRSKHFDPQKTVLLEEEPDPYPPAKPKKTPNHPGIKIRSYETDEVIIDVASMRPGFLLLLDNWFPGWDAYLNDKKIPLYRANYTFRAIRIPKGKSTVRFTYKPRAFWLGVSLTLLSIFILLAICVPKKA